MKTHETKSDIEKKETISEEEKNYELVEKMIQPLITKEWQNQKNEVVFTEKDWTETWIQVIKKGNKLLHNEQIIISLVNLTINTSGNGTFFTKTATLILDKWYNEFLPRYESKYKISINIKEISEDERILGLTGTDLNTALINSNGYKEITLDEFQKILKPKIEENIKQYFLFIKNKKIEENTRETRKRQEEIKNAIDF